VDGGPEISLINARTLRRLRIRGVTEQSGGKGQILLVDATPAKAPDTVTVRIRVASRTVTHTFAILPNMESDVLLGIDAQAKLRLGLPPPPLTAAADPKRCCTAEGLASQTEEREELEQFLSREMGKFQDVRGCTEQLTHEIRCYVPQQNFLFLIQIRKACLYNL